MERLRLANSGDIGTLAGRLDARGGNAGHGKSVLTNGSRLLPVSHFSIPLSLTERPHLALMHPSSGCDRGKDGEPTLSGRSLVFPYFSETIHPTSYIRNSYPDEKLRGNRILCMIYEYICRYFPDTESVSYRTFALMVALIGWNEINAK